MKVYIYLITNRQNRKMYIGISNDPELRFWVHCNNADFSIGKAIKKYKQENFDFEILDWVCDYDYAFHLEQLYIKELNTISPFGYNLNSGGEGGKKHSEETIVKMREAHLRENLSEETLQKMSASLSGKNNPMYGKKHSEETIIKIKTNLPHYSGENHFWYGRKHKLESVAKMKKSRMDLGLSEGENNPFFGKRHSKETLQKMRESKLGKKHSVELIEKFKETMKIKRAIKELEKLDELCFPPSF